MYSFIYNTTIYLYISTHCRSSLSLDHRYVISYKSSVYLQTFVLLLDHHCSHNRLRHSLHAVSSRITLPGSPFTIGCRGVQSDPLPPKSGVVRNPLSLVVHVSDSASTDNLIPDLWSTSRVSEVSHISTPKSGVIFNPAAHVVHIAYSLLANSNDPDVLVLHVVHPETVAVRPPISSVEHELSALATNGAVAEPWFWLGWLRANPGQVSVPDTRVVRHPLAAVEHESDSSAANGDGFNPAELEVLTVVVGVVTPAAPVPEEPDASTVDRSVGHSWSDWCWGHLDHVGVPEMSVVPHPVTAVVHVADSSTTDGSVLKVTVLDVLGVVVVVVSPATVIPEVFDALTIDSTVGVSWSFRGSVDSWCLAADPLCVDYPVSNPSSTNSSTHWSSKEVSLTSNSSDSSTVDIHVVNNGSVSSVSLGQTNSLDSSTSDSSKSDSSKSKESDSPETGKSNSAESEVSDSAKSEESDSSETGDSDSTKSKDSHSSETGKSNSAESKISDSAKSDESDSS